MIITDDFSNFDPSKQFSFPDEGKQIMQIIAEKHDFKNPTDPNAKYGFLQLTIQTAKGQKFDMSFLTGHPSPQTAKIAKENLVRIFYAIYKQKPPVTGLDTSLLLNRPFVATISIVDSKGDKKREDGTPFKNINLSGYEPIDIGTPAPQIPNAGYAPSYSAQQQPTNNVQPNYDNAVNAPTTAPWAQPR